LTVVKHYNYFPSYTFLLGNLTCNVLAMFLGSKLTVSADLVFSRKLQCNTYTYVRRALQYTAKTNGYYLGTHKLRTTSMWIRHPPT